MEQLKKSAPKFPVKNIFKNDGEILANTPTAVPEDQVQKLKVTLNSVNLN